MKTLIAAAIRCYLLFLIPTVAYGISAQWDLDPISGDWNTAANWTPNGVPNGPADIATFGLSNTTDVSISANTEVNSIIFAPAATNPYTITASPGLTLTISGAGIVNNSGTTHFFLTAVDGSGNSGTIVFSNSATAGTSSIVNTGNSESGGATIFKDTSTAGSANINIGENASVNFFNRSTADNAHLATDGASSFTSINFFNRSSAASATIEDFGGFASVNFFNGSTAGSSLIDLSAASFSRIFFHDNSTAGNATLYAGEALVRFSDRSTAADATIISAGFFIDFFDLSSAGSATIESYGSGIFFEDFSRGGTAAIGLFLSPATERGGLLSISDHSAPGVSIGSLEGDEFALVLLGSNNLTIGSNNLSTTFSGVIRDGFVGTGGSLTKIGTGTLILSGANTYTGDTNINRGVLQVDGSITSNTFVNNRGTLAGTGTVHGNVMNNEFGTVRPGGALGSPGMLTVTGNFTQAQYATLMIQIAGASAGEFSVLNVLGNASLDGFLNPVLLNGFVPALGDSFVFLNYGSLTGQFAHIRHRFFNDGTLQWSVIYEAQHAILTVEQHVPDPGSTFLFLTLGLFGLVAYRRQLLLHRQT
jgi:autotransporter-associated beta strand protein